MARLPKVAFGLPRYSDFPENLGPVSYKRQIGRSPHKSNTLTPTWESIVDRSTGICRIFTKATGAPLDAELANRKAEGAARLKWWDERSAEQQRLRDESGYTTASVSDDAAFAACSATVDVIAEARSRVIGRHGDQTARRHAGPWSRQHRRTTRRQRSG
jgi:hypothetical protein